MAIVRSNRARLGPGGSLHSKVRKPFSDLEPSASVVFYINLKNIILWGSFESQVRYIHEYGICIFEIIYACIKDI